MHDIIPKITIRVACRARKTIRDRITAVSDSVTVEYCPNKLIFEPCQISYFCFQLKPFAAEKLDFDLILFVEPNLICTCREINMNDSVLLSRLVIAYDVLRELIHCCYYINTR